MTAARQSSGFLLIDKPAGLSSFDVIRQLRKRTLVRAFGHAGTLDPFATGLMILAYKRFTRLLSLLELADKEYTATMILGTQTSTGDPEGEVIATSDRLIKSDQLDELKPQILQISKLKPPLHSAVKVDGKRSYARARANEEFDLPEREARVFEFDIVEFDYPKLVYTCRVSKGTYIRSLSQFIAQTLGTVGYTKELKRTAIGALSLNQAHKLDDITIDNLESVSTPVRDILPNLESLFLKEDELHRLKQGKAVKNPGSDNLQILIFDDKNICQGIALRKENTLYPKVNL
ncbi:MAG: tRNA pseudouridine(55) synthase TruB [Candidatus Cloacimonadaceae bacterium]